MSTALSPSIPDEVLQALREGRELRPFEWLGAHLVPAGESHGAGHGAGHSAGTRFALWAPNAGAASVVGSFNGWDGRLHRMHHRGDSGVWELFIEGVTEGALYKFELHDRHGHLLPLKADPYARGSQLRPDNASVVAPMPLRCALPEGRAQANSRQAPIAIYEVHLGSWRRRGGLEFLNWDELANCLPAYVRDLGFTHIELMPVTEHPYDGSWGYQTLGQFAPTARHGDMQGFLRLVRACHEHGLGVLIDWVPAHFPSDAHGLARFDGTALYEYDDPREGFHRDWNTLIFNFGRWEVRDFLTASALYWLERGGVDGLRVDAVASMLYRDYSRQDGQWIPNHQGGRENFEAIGLLQHVNTVLGRECPGAITVAEESTAYPGVSAPVFNGGLGFHYKWNMGWMNDTLAYMKEDPVHRKWHHDKMRFGLMYAFSENFVLPLSHDEVVHGKGSILGRMPGDEWQRFSNLRAYYGFMWGHPGKKLLFMGQEFAQGSEWNSAEELPWWLLDHAPHRGVQQLVRDLNALYRQQPALHRLDFDAAGFEWLVLDDADNSVLAWARKDGQGAAVIVVCNFTPVLRPGYCIGLPLHLATASRAWREVINTDARCYGGSGEGNGGLPIAVGPEAAHGHGHAIRLTIPPLATVFLVPE